jgi:hypothetical protein
MFILFMNIMNVTYHILQIHISHIYYIESHMTSSCDLAVVCLWQPVSYPVNVQTLKRQLRTLQFHMFFEWSLQMRTALLKFVKCLLPWHCPDIALPFLSDFLSLSALSACRHPISHVYAFYCSVNPFPKESSILETSLSCWPCSFSISNGVI